MKCRRCQGNIAVRPFINDGGRWEYERYCIMCSEIVKPDELIRQNEVARMMARQSEGPGRWPKEREF